MDVKTTNLKISISSTIGSVSLEVVACEKPKAVVTLARCRGRYASSVYEIGFRIFGLRGDLLRAI